MKMMMMVMVVSVMQMVAIVGCGVIFVRRKKKDRIIFGCVFQSSSTLRNGVL